MNIKVQKGKGKDFKILKGAGYIELGEKTLCIYMKDGRGHSTSTTLWSGDTLIFTDKGLPNEWHIHFEIKK